jgi:predicted PurR-regulated permease PerM
MAMYIGSQLFGFIGLFLLPITLVMIKLLNDEGIIHVFHKDAFEEDNND